MGKIKSFLIGGALGAAAGAYFLSEAGQKSFKKLSGNVSKAASDAVENVKKNSKITDYASQFADLVSKPFGEDFKEEPKRSVTYIPSTVKPDGSVSGTEHVIKAETAVSSKKKTVNDSRSFSQRTNISTGVTDAEKRNPKIKISNRDVIQNIKNKRNAVVQQVVSNAKKNL